MVAYLLLAAACFAFNYAHYAVGARLDTAHREKRASHAANWATLAETLGWVDAVVFGALLVEDGLRIAVITTAVPSILGARIGQYYSTRADWVSERIRKAKRQARLAKKTGDS